MQHFIHLTLKIKAKDNVDWAGNYWQNFLFTCATTVCQNETCLSNRLLSHAKKWNTSKLNHWDEGQGHWRFRWNATILLSLSACVSVPKIENQRPVICSCMTRFCGIRPSTGVVDNILTEAALRVWKRHKLHSSSSCVSIKTMDDEQWKRLISGMYCTIIRLIICEVYCI